MKNLNIIHVTGLEILNKKLWEKRFSQNEIENLSDSTSFEYGKELTKRISEADKAYHTFDSPELTDSEYDNLKFNLQWWNLTEPPSNFFTILIIFLFLDKL